MDYEKFKQDMEQDVLKNLANRGIEAVIAKSWDYEKNTDMDPNSIASTSRISAWWNCDKGHGCPYCSGQLPSRTRIVP